MSALPAPQATPDTATASDPVRVAYIMSRFPKLTETFVLYEILALEAQGVPVEVFPLLREKSRVVHPETAAVVARARFHPFVSWRIVRAHLHYLRHRPAAYLGVVAEVLRGTLGSANFFVGALGILPKSVRFAYEMQALGVTHVHAHFATHPAVAALIVHRLTGIPFSFTAHGSDLHVERRMLDRKVAAAAFAVAISRFNQEIMLRECGEAAREKIHVVHCGVDPQRFPRQTGEHRGGALRILCVAAFEEVKGHRTLIDACRQLRDLGVRFVCDLVGTGPLQSEIQSWIAASHLDGMVRLHGAQPRQEVARMLAAADVFCLPSVPTAGGKREGIPVVLMEAMASELPVVSSRLSGIPELVADGISGWLVEPRDSAGLADALARLGADPTLRLRMGRAGRRIVDEQFHQQKNAGILQRLFTASSQGKPWVPETSQAGNQAAPCST
jgi:colanic acid/amylovoran biosynthesis glycosyltransferase